MKFDIQFRDFCKFLLQNKSNKQKKINSSWKLLTSTFNKFKFSFYPKWLSIENVDKLPRNIKDDLVYNLIK